MSKTEASKSIVSFARRALALMLVFALSVTVAGCTFFSGGKDSSSGGGSASGQTSGSISQGSGSASQGAGSVSQGTGSSSITVREDGEYTSKEEVALYIHLYGHLPSNYISKTRARNAGWDSQKGNLDKVCPGKSIGGSRYYDDDNQLPSKRGRTWTECDINYHGGYRGAERIVFSNDGLIYYTADHYETFERLY